MYVGEKLTVYHVTLQKICTYLWEKVTVHHGTLGKYCIMYLWWRSLLCILLHCKKFAHVCGRKSQYVILNWGNLSSCTCETEVNFTSCYVTMKNLHHVCSGKILLYIMLHCENFPSLICERSLLYMVLHCEKFVSCLFGRSLQ